MKKFLVILMVVAMATFLFVGCKPTVPETYTLTMAVNPTGGGTTTPAIGANPGYTDGTVVPITATPAADYQFVNWIGDVANLNSASTTVTMNADKTVTANFELIPVVNEPPVITSTAITSGKVGVAYTYDVDATDPDGDTLTYSLTAAPLGMTIVAATGVISWTPTAAGSVEVGVKVSDTKLSDTQSFKITVEEEDVTLLITEAPVITSIPDIVGGYINKAAAADGIVVNGTAPTYSEVKVYINGICAGTGDTGVNGVFVVVVAKADLTKAVKVDGAKTLYATAIEPGLSVSASSNVKKFTLDTVAPKILSSKATAGTVGIAGTAKVYQFIETADTTGTYPCSAAPCSTSDKFREVLIVNTTICCPGTTCAQIKDIICIDCVVVKPIIGEKITSPWTAIPASNALLVGEKDWKIEVRNVLGSGDTADYVTMRVSNLTDGYYQDYTYNQIVGSGTVSTSWIPGVKVTVGLMSPAINIGSYSLLTTKNIYVAATAGTAGYIDVTFSETVTGVSILATAAKWTAFAATINLYPTITVRSSTVARLTETDFYLYPDLKVGRSYDVSCTAIKDLAGNPSGILTTGGVVVK